MAGMTGWLTADPTSDTTRFAGGVRFLCIGLAVFALTFGALALLALSASPRQTVALAVCAFMAAGNGLSAFGLSTRSRWGWHVGLWWNLIAFFAWFLVIFVAQGFNGQPLTLILIGAGLVFAVLFHLAGAVYLAYGRLPNLRYRERVADPRHWGPHWVVIETPRAFAHPQGRFGGKLWIVFGLVLLSMVAEASGLWLSPGVMQIIGVALHVAILMFLVLRVPLAWPLTLLWAALSMLRGIVSALVGATADPASMILLIYGVACAFSSVWVMLYMSEAARPNLVYRRRYRRLLDGEVF